MPVQRILVSPKVSGMIVKLDILEGRRVKKGDILAELEDVDYKADLAHAESSLEAARQRLAEIEAMRPKEIGQAKAELERAKAELVQLKSDLRPQQRPVFEAQGPFAVGLRAGREQVSLGRSARSLAWISPWDCWRVRGARRWPPRKRKFAQAEADVVKARWQLDNCKIRAPISGTILKKNAEEGNLVNPIAMNGSFSLCDLADLSDLEVELTIEERDISKVSVGQKCKVRTEAYPESHLRRRGLAA